MLNCVQREGRQYYLDAPENEEFYFERLLKEAEGLLASLKVQQGRKKMLPGLRGYTQQLFPALALQLKMKEDWDYKGLYLAALEELAKMHRISRFKIYTTEELKQLIARRAAHAATPAPEDS